MRVRGIFIAVASLAFVGCSSNSNPTSNNCPSPGKSGSVTVLAASSMKNVLADIRDSYLADHPCVTALDISFGSSGELATQIVNGAPADVFFAANEKTKDTVLNAGRSETSASLVARNKMAILVNRKSQYAEVIQKLTDLQDVVHPDITVGVCADSAPCGAILPTLLEADELEVADIADTQTNSVQDLVTKLVMGELDAGIVFGSDCEQARRTDSAICVDINQDLPNPVSSPLYVMQLNNRSNTTDFVEFFTSSETKSLMQKTYGFLAP